MFVLGNGVPLVPAFVAVAYAALCLNVRLIRP